jgi:hypothetical protein
LEIVYGGVLINIRKELPIKNKPTTTINPGNTFLRLHFQVIITP